MQAMVIPFYHHLNKYVKLTEQDFEEILTYFETIDVGKKEILMEEGTLCNRNFMVLNGCLHMYYINDKGAEKTVQFALENWWITDHLAYHHQQKTTFFIQAITPGQVLKISRDRQNQLLSDFPVLAMYFMSIYQIAYGAAIMRTKYLFDSSKEEIFLSFSKKYPEFVQRVPQFQLATYLGLTPEYVSEIRKKRRS
jgi:CRP-like cAMP-binding protein